MAEANLGSHPKKLTPVSSLPSPLPPPCPGRVYVPSRCLPSFIFNLCSECRKPLLAVNIRESEPKHILEGFPVWDFRARLQPARVEASEQLSPAGLPARLLLSGSGARCHLAGRC